jgi:UDP-N-acetylmuramyl-tripeptide synthetase
MKGIRGSEYDFVSKDERVHIQCNIAGGFSLSNSLCAIGAAKELGIDAETIAAAMESLTNVAGRMEKVALPTEDITVIVDYAHTPDALENVLKSIRDCRLPEQRLVCLFGCGGDRDRTKRPVMGGIATELADYTIITGDNSRTEDPQRIINDILAGVKDSVVYDVIPDRRSALFHAVMNAQKDDIILVAGKGHEDYEIIAAFTTPVYTDHDFEYYKFTATEDPTEFDSYVRQCKEKSIYETGKTAQYGQRLLTLSTCEYSQKNGRMVIVAVQTYKPIKAAKEGE